MIVVAALLIALSILAAEAVREREQQLRAEIMQLKVLVAEIPSYHAYDESPRMAELKAKPQNENSCDNLRS